MPIGLLEVAIVALIGISTLALALEFMNSGGRRQQRGKGLLSQWFDAWLNVHVMAAMIVWRQMNRLNDNIFGMLMWAARMNAKETVHQAVARCDIRKVEKLVFADPKRGAILSELDDESRTALHVALERLEEALEEEEVEAESQEEEAEAESRTRRRTGPSSAEWLAMVRWLLAHQSDVNTRGAQERAPIHLAVRASMHEVVKGLLAAGADATLACNGMSTLRQATVQRDRQMIALLLEGAASMSYGGLEFATYVNSIGKDGWSALGLAARAGDAAIVQALLEAGADRAAAMPNGKTALDVARLNRKDAVVALLEAPASS